jgi:hypothetical protein
MNFKKSYVEINEIAIENSGDIFLHLINPIIMSIFAENSE